MFTRDNAAAWGRVGGLTTAARGHVNGRAGRATAEARFAAAADPEAARRAHYARLGILSGQARRAKAAGRRAAGGAKEAA